MTDVEGGHVASHQGRPGRRRSSNESADGKPAATARKNRSARRARGRDIDGRREFRELRRAIEAEIPSFSQIATLLELGISLERLPFAERIVGRRLQELGDDAVLWAPSDKLSKYRDLLTRSKTLVRLKYGFEECPANVDILAVADRVAHRAKPDPVAYDRLFSMSNSGLDRDEWERRMRQASVVEHIVNDRQYVGLPGTAVLSALRPGAWEAVASEIREADRIICVIFHSGFLSINRFLFGRESGWSTLRGRNTRNADASADNSRNALFAAFRDLRDGKPLLAAPDGPFGKLSEELEVLGMTLPIGEGSAFLAFEADARTVWLQVVRTGAELVPVLVEGPRRMTGEKYQAFKARWIEFYGHRITETLVGDPANMALRGRWFRAFSGEENDTAD